MTILNESRYIVDPKGSVGRSDREYQSHKRKVDQTISQNPSLRPLVHHDKESHNQAYDIGLSLTPLTDHEETARIMGNKKSHKNIDVAIENFWGHCPKIIDVLHELGDGFNSIKDWKPQEVKKAFPDEFGDSDYDSRSLPWIVQIKVDHYSRGVDPRLLGEEEYQLEFYPAFAEDGSTYLHGIQIEGGPGHMSGYYESKHYNFNPAIIGDQIVTDIYQDL